LTSETFFGAVFWDWAFMPGTFRIAWLSMVYFMARWASNRNSFKLDIGSHFLGLEDFCIQLIICFPCHPRAEGP
jgi:hypothetical protein